MSAPALSREDWTRLKTLQERVEGYMLEAYDREGRSGGWRTLPRIQASCGGTEASCSARLRQADTLHNLVKDRRPVPGTRGLFEYRLRPRVAEQLGIFG